MVLLLRSKASISGLGWRFEDMEKETVSLITWMSLDRKKRRCHKKRDRIIPGQLNPGDF